MAGTWRTFEIPLCAAIISVVVTSALNAQPVAQPPATAPATQPAAAEQRDEAFLKMMRDARAGTRTSTRNFPEIGSVRSVGELIQMALVNSSGQLDVQYIAPASIADAQTPGRVRLEGTDTVFQIQPTGRKMIGGAAGGAFRVPGQARRLTRYDFGAEGDEEIWSTTLIAGAQTVSLAGLSITGRVTLSQVNGRVIFTAFTRLTAAAPFKAVFTATAPSLLELRNQHPKEFQARIAPLLGKFCDLRFLRPGAGDVYAVFDDIPADEQVFDRVIALLPRLEAGDSLEREKASVELSKLGTPGVLAALRLIDARADELAFEQQARLSKFIAGTRTRVGLDPDDAHGDVMFLADCLDFDDVVVRDAAKDALEEVLGHAIDFDTRLGPEARQAALNGLRPSLPVPVPPQTQPADTQPAVEVVPALPR